MPKNIKIYGPRHFKSKKLDRILIFYTYIYIYIKEKKKLGQMPLRRCTRPLNQSTLVVMATESNS